MKTIVTVVGLLSALATFLTFAPRLSVQTEGSVRATDPFGTVFYLLNESSLAVHDINSSCDINNTTTTSSAYFDGVSVVGPDNHADILSGKHKMTLPCQRIMDLSNVATSAKLTIRVKYRPDWAWWYRTDTFPMQAEKTSDDKWIWKSTAN
jgi:hypothetical protein